MSSPFPLLRLPGVVLCEVFKSLSIEEKIKLSFCSKRMSTQIYIARMYSQKVIVDLDMIYQGIRVHSENDKDSCSIFNCPDSWKYLDSNTHHFSIECCTVKITFIPTGIKIFWKNHQEGFLSVIRYLLKIFRCKISTSSDCHCTYFFQPTISKLFDLQQEFKALTIHLNGSKDQHSFWDQICSKFGLVEDLRIISVANLGFRPVFASWPQKISITGSDWFFLEHLLACTCTRITLEGSHLENKDMDEILRNWKAGGFPNLEYLEIHSQGMNRLELREKVVQTDDGSKKATLRTYLRSIEMSVTPFE